mmetsp:Transcript_129135/g.306407  ORF Transcript_129135/g.306407 Transcript_129135/m.306407 type:complete len:227 (+) Transcript_129135:1111-1791(+)
MPGQGIGFTVTRAHGSSCVWDVLHELNVIYSRPNAVLQRLFMTVLRQRAKSSPSLASKAFVMTLRLESKAHTFIILHQLGCSLQSCRLVQPTPGGMVTEEGVRLHEVRQIHSVVPAGECDHCLSRCFWRTNNLVLEDTRQVASVVSMNFDSWILAALHLNVFARELFADAGALLSGDLMQRDREAVVASGNRPVRRPSEGVGEPDDKPVALEGLHPKSTVLDGHNV